MVTRRRKENMKTEIWNGYTIRFVEKDGEWWAIAQDICNALGLKQVTRALSGLPSLTKSKVGVQTGVKSDGTPAMQMVNVNIICEKDIYRLVFKSRKSEAEAFQDWVYEMLKELRKQTGLEGFEVFRMLDKEHQKEMMKVLHEGLKHPERVDYIKANTISNKAISNKYGFFRKCLKRKI